MSSKELACAENHWIIIAHARWIVSDNTNAYAILKRESSHYRVIVIADDLLFPDYSDQLDLFLSQTVERIVT